MARAKLEPQVLDHLEWIGFIQPTGLVVSAPALVRAGAILDRRDAEGHRLLRACVEQREFNAKTGPEPYLPSFRDFATSVLDWSFSPKGYAGTPENPIPLELEIDLVDYGETLRADFAVRELSPAKGNRRGSSSSRCSRPVRISTANPVARASSRPLPMAAWNGSCAAPVFPQVSCLTVSPCA